ncbi:MAG TPA: DUF456 domain-containing protein [Candidatus Limnocylindria bacterium]|nr:DUF456 domain-containing protein [Candidatus Limnocylindria bacterium]
MTTEQIIGLALALFVMCIGCLGSILPAVPSTPLVLIAAIGHKLYFGATGSGWITLTLLLLITALALVMDYLASLYGAKRFGATKKGMAGAIIGGIVGLFFNLPGILLGPFIGATTFEMAGGREWKPAMKAGIGATLGLFAGAIGKFVCCFSMMMLFTINVIWRSLRAA